VAEESLDLSSFVFSHVPGRSIHKSDFLAPRRRDRIETALKQRIDEHWVNRAWDQPEHRARAEEANQSSGAFTQPLEEGGEQAPKGKGAARESANAAEPFPTPSASSDDSARIDDSADVEVYPGSVSRSVWAKVKVIDAIFKTRLNQGVGRDQIVCESLQDCFDLLAKEILKRNDDLKDGVQRGVIQNTLLEIAVALAWLAPQMAPSNIAWAHREWLMRLLEGRIEYFESCLPGGTPGDIDQLGYVVIKVPETNPLFQSEDALEELNTQLSQPPKVFDIEALKLHASSAYGTQPEKVTPGQLEATIDAFMRKYRSIRVTGMPATLLGKGDGAPQPSDSKFVRAEPPVLESKPVGYAGRTVSP
jgi:hypothetical protein